MSESPLARAQRRTREALQIAPPPAGTGPLQPGDLVVLPRTAGFPVEWAVLDRATAPRRLWLVPADTHPIRGHGDIEIPAGEPGGPLWLRCRFATWVSGDPEPEAAQRTGRLALPWIQEAKDRCGQLARGIRSVSSLADEAEADPEYQDWERQVLEPARFALEERPAEAAPVRRRPRSSVRLWQGLAAACLAATVGLSVWVVQLRQQLDRPVARVVPHGVVYDGPSRGSEERTEAPRLDPPALSVTVPAQQLEPGSVYVIEVRTLDGRLLARPRFTALRDDDTVLSIAFRSQPDTCRLRLFRLKNGDWGAEDEGVVVHFVDPAR